MKDLVNTLKQAKEANDWALIDQAINELEAGKEKSDTDKAKKDSEDGALLAKLRNTKFQGLGKGLGKGL